MAAKEKLIIKIIQQPAELPCSDCKKDCRGDAFMRCKKLKTYNKKITAKEYDYDKVIEVMAKVLTIVKTGSKLCVKGKEVNAKEFAVAILNAILEGGENEAD